MELGQRIKAARLEAGLSQRQLCGDVITRNMLSLIESGRARPSMDTLGYLAGRLGKPMGYFLEDQAVLSPNQSIMDCARTAYTGGDWRAVMEALEPYRAPDPVFDPERYLLGALAAVALARQAVTEGKAAYALRLLEQAKAWGGLTVYWTEALERGRLLVQFQADPTQAKAVAQALPEDATELLLRARAVLDEDPVRCGQILDAAGVRDEGWFLLRGQAAMEAGDFKAAAGYLHRAEAAFPRACVPALERCYRELEDFKRAYEYACKQRDRE